MSPGLTWDSSNLVPKEAQLFQVRFRIPRSNADQLIAQIVFQNTIPAEVPVVNNSWDLGLWIYSPAIWCFDSKNCDYILNVIPNYNGKALIRKHGGFIDWGTAKTLDCPAPWRLEKDGNSRSVLSIYLSQTCLGISKSFVSYAYSSLDIGLEKRPYHFTSPNYVDNGYFELAKQAYEAAGGRKSLNKSLTSDELNKLKEVLESARTNYTGIMNRYESLAPEIQNTIQTQKQWKTIKSAKKILDEIEKSIENQTPDDQEITTWFNQLIKIVNIQIAWLEIELKIVPRFQCTNSITRKKTIERSGKCPPGFKRVRTQQAVNLR